MDVADGVGDHARGEEQRDRHVPVPVGAALGIGSTVRELDARLPEALTPELEALRSLTFREERGSVLTPDAADLPARQRQRDLERLLIARRPD